MSEIINIKDQDKLGSEELTVLEDEARVLLDKLFKQSNKAIFYQPDLSEHLAMIGRKQAEVARMLQDAINFLEKQE